jgi:MFS family permease
MLNIVLAVVMLLVSVAILLLGNGMLGTLVGLRAGLEGFTADLTGVVMSAYFGGFVAGSVTCPALIARTGHIRAFAILAALAAAAAPLYAYLPHPAVWFGLRFVSGVCMMGLYMVIESWLNEVAPRATRGRVFGVYMAVNLLAIAAAQGLVVIAPVAASAPFVLAGVLVTLSLIPIALTRLPEPARVPATPLSLASLTRLPRLGLVTAFATGLALGAFWGMGAMYGQRIGLGAGGVAGFMAATILGGAALQWPIGHWSDRHERRLVLAATAWVACAAAGVAALVSSAWPQGVTGVAVLYGGCAFALYSLGVASVTDAVPAHEVVDATRALLLVNGIGAALGPVSVGYAMSVARPGAFFVYAALVLGALALFATRARHAPDSVPVSEQGHFTVLARTSPAALEMYPDDAATPAVREDL